MQLVKEKYKIRCELGVCKNTADYAVVPDRVGVKSRVHVCGGCLKTLGKLIIDEFAPKTAEVGK